MTKPVVVIGAGGHARVLIDCLRLMKREILGVTTQEPGRSGGTYEGLKILGDETVLHKYPVDQIEIVNAVGTTRVDSRRQSVFDSWKGLGYAFASVIHPSAIVASSASLGEGVQVMARAVIQPGSRIAQNSIINTAASIDHDANIGEHVHIAPGCVLSGGVTVGSASHLGTGAVVIQGVTLGKSVLVAAGAVVTRNIEDGQSVAGVPARLRG
jgi:sugar O-acyltransferase (sialic acid O-acetyltransferase NeuD family)